MDLVKEESDTRKYIEGTIALQKLRDENFNFKNFQLLDRAIYTLQDEMEKEELLVFFKENKDNYIETRLSNSDDRDEAYKRELLPKIHEEVF